MRVESWLVQPSERHWKAFRQMMAQGQAAANLVTDAHLAALAVEHGCEWMSTDAGFARFPELGWQNPLQIGIGPLRKTAPKYVMAKVRPFVVCAAIK